MPSVNVSRLRCRSWYDIHMKKSTFFLILGAVIAALGVSVTAGYFMAGPGWGSNWGSAGMSALAPSSATSTSPSATATFVCADGATIQAAFYNGASIPSANPNEPPTLTGSVALTLSDGRTMTLPQAVSADGARYASVDGSVVFWNVGDTATLTENGTTTYANCTTTPAQTSSVQSAYFGENSSTALGAYLTDSKGMTLYTFTHDTVNKSNCSGACLAKWPPYGPGVSASGTYSMPMLPVNVGVIAGSNGMMQFTWKGMPLYYYSLDKAPGQTLGEGVLNAWYVVKQ